jgi:hypothetical protein
MAASALIGTGALAMTSPATADDDDNDTDADHDENDDMTDDGNDDDDNGSEFSSLQDIVNNPDNYYVDIHTEAFPQGSVRGQLDGEPGTTEFTVQGDPAQVPDEEGGGNPDASATFDLQLFPDEEVICFDICARGVTPPYESPATTATHIHEGDRGVVGPPVVVFPDPQPRDPDFDGPRTSSGCLPGELAFQTGVNGDDDDGDDDEPESEPEEESQKNPKSQKRNQTTKTTLLLMMTIPMRPRMATSTATTSKHRTKRRRSSNRTQAIPTISTAIATVLPANTCPDFLP